MMEPPMLSRHPYFEPWDDPVTGLRSYILSRHVAPVEQGFYFTQHDMSQDQRWLWFYCAFPPAATRTVGIVCLDPDRPEIRHFPQAAFEPETPMVEDDGQTVLLAIEKRIYRMDVQGDMECVFELPEDYIAGRQLYRLATHLSRSCDGRYLLLDGQIGNHCFFGLAELATGEFKLLHEVQRFHNHGQFSPVDPNLFSVAQDRTNDPVTGRRFPFDHRIWLMDTQGTRFEPVSPKDWASHGTVACHEWWSADGWMCWTDYQHGAYECNTETGERNRVWPTPLCHTHCDRQRRLFCADQTPYLWPKTPCSLRLFDRTVNREIDFVSAMPGPDFPTRLYRTYPRKRYHQEPHPHFSPKNDLIVYTTHVRGRCELAIAPVAPIVAALQDRGRPVG